MYGIYAPSIAFKAALEIHAELESDPRVSPTPYMAHNGWLSLRADEATDWTLARRLIEHSYRQVAPRKLLAELES
jgi:predicted DNA-binding protein (MmcQ/YjbR family)